jgi:hypothetical protein
MGNRDDMTIEQMLGRLAEIGAGLPPSFKMEAGIKAAFKINEELAAERNTLRKDLEETRALLERWVYGNASTEDLRQLCADTAAALPPDARPTRYDQVAAALGEMMDAAKGSKP